MCLRRESKWPWIAIPLASSQSTLPPPHTFLLLPDGKLMTESPTIGTPPDYFALWTDPEWFVQSKRKEGHIALDESLTEACRVAAQTLGEDITVSALDGAGRGVCKLLCKAGEQPIELPGPNPGTWPEGAKR